MPFSLELVGMMQPSVQLGGVPGQPVPLPLKS